MSSKADQIRAVATMAPRREEYPPGMDPAEASRRPPRLEGVKSDRAAAWIETSRITPDPDQPRTVFEAGAIERLAESLRAHGQLQPIRVRWDQGAEVYRIIAGERRWRAAQVAGITTMQCTMQETEDATETLVKQLAENALREDLKPIEQAHAFRRLIESTGWTMTRLAEELSIHQTTVSRSLSLLDLAAEIQTEVEQGTITPTAATKIAKLHDAGQQKAVAQVVREKSLSVEAVNELVETISRRREPAPRLESRTVQVAGWTITVKPTRAAQAIPVEQILRRAIKTISG